MLKSFFEEVFKMNMQIEPAFPTIYHQPDDDIEGYNGYHGIMKTQAKNPKNAFNWGLIEEYDPVQIRTTKKTRNYEPFLDAFTSSTLSIPDMKIIQNPLVFKLLEILQSCIIKIRERNEKNQKLLKQFKCQSDSLNLEAKKQKMRAKTYKKIVHKCKTAQRCPTCQKLFDSQLNLDKHMNEMHHKLYPFWAAIRANDACSVKDPDKEMEKEINEMRRTIRAQNQILIENEIKKQQEKREKKKQKEEQEQSDPVFVLPLVIDPFHTEEVKEEDDRQNKAEKDEEIKTIPIVKESETKNKTKTLKESKEIANEFLTRKDSASNRIQSNMDKITKGIQTRIHQHSQIMKMRAKKEEKDALRTYIEDTNLGIPHRNMSYLRLLPQRASQAVVPLNSYSSQASYTSVTFIQDTDDNKSYSSSSSSSSSSKTKTLSKSKSKAKEKSSSSSSKSKSKSKSSSSESESKKKEKKQKTNQKDENDDFAEFLLDDDINEAEILNNAAKNNDKSSMALSSDSIPIKNEKIVKIITDPNPPKPINPNRVDISNDELDKLMATDTK